MSSIADKKDWYKLSRDISKKLDDLHIGASDERIVRPLYIYSLCKPLIDLLNDREKCNNYSTRQVIDKAMEEIIYELYNYTVYDVRENNTFDEGKGYQH